MSVRTFLFRTLLFLGALLLIAGLVEAWLRNRLFSNDPAFAAWRDPQLYTHRYKVDGRIVVRDDHDKLAVQWGLLRRSEEHPHPLLGWCGALDSATLLPPGFTKAIAGPVLLGAGWAEHSIGRAPTSGPTDTLPAYVDLGVPGFTLDQDLLLFQRIRTHIRGRELLLLIDLDRIDRLQRTFVGRPKPWYTMAAYSGELHGVPVTTGIPAYLEADPADPGLYSYHLFRTQVLHDTIMSASATEAAERELRELGKKLLFTLFSEAREDSIAVSVYLEQNGLGALADRRRWSVQDACRDMGITCHVLGEEAEAVGHRDQVRMMGIFRDHVASRTGLPDYTSLTQLKALQERPESERTPLEQRMVTLLMDASLSAQVRERAAAKDLSFAMMVQRDAQFTIEHEQR